MGKMVSQGQTAISTSSTHLKALKAARMCGSPTARPGQRLCWPLNLSRHAMSRQHVLRCDDQLAVCGVVQVGVHI